ncbi:MAG TPA: MBL fold metallo-hydrolase [Thermoanaerobaculia bacterium]|nr:MBL fold metallo-hydrolase [Thermoanaerobaculia bacterium]
MGAGEASDLEEGNLYEAALRQLAAAGGGAGRGAGASALPRARASASVVPWRRRNEGGGRSPGGIEVFWVKRSETLPFMGGWHAFPGGGLARADAEVPVAGRPAGGREVGGRRGDRGPEGGGGGAEPDRAALDRADGGGGGEADLMPGIVACAIRELFEETGILLACPEPAAASGEHGGCDGHLVEGAAELAAARRELLAGRPFAEVLRRLGAVADASRLVYAGRWLTPPFSPLRFDSRFFLLEWPPEEAAQPEVLPGELESGSWIEPGAAWESWHRGENLAAPPILHLLEVLRQDGPEAGLGRLRDPAEADLGPIRRVELRPGVIMFPLPTATLPPASTTNAYLLGAGEAVLVDPGSGDRDALARLEQALRAARERLRRRVTAIWLTHHHPDHVGGAAALRERLGVPVLAHALTAERLARHGVPVDGELHDGQRVALAGAPEMAVAVVHTPGHARGHLCFLEEGQRSLLAGDMVAGIGTIVIDPPEGDMDDYLASLDKLIALAPGTLFPGHGPAVKDAAAKLREYRAHRLWREEKVMAAWRAGRREAAAMVPTVYDDAPPEAHRLAERQIVAHLARLRRAGRLTD